MLSSSTPSTAILVPASDALPPSPSGLSSSSHSSSSSSSSSLSSLCDRKMDRENSARYVEAKLIYGRKIVKFEKSISRDIKEVSIDVIKHDRNLYFNVSNLVKSLGMSDSECGDLLNKMEGGYVSMRRNSSDKIKYYCRYIEDNIKIIFPHACSKELEPLFAKERLDYLNSPSSWKFKTSVCHMKANLTYEREIEKAERRTSPDEKNVSIEIVKYAGKLYFNFIQLMENFGAISDHYEYTDLLRQMGQPPVVILCGGRRAIGCYEYTLANMKKILPLTPPDRLNPLFSDGSIAALNHSFSSTGSRVGKSKAPPISSDLKSSETVQPVVPTPSFPLSSSTSYSDELNIDVSGVDMNKFEEEFFRPKRKSSGEAKTELMDSTKQKRGKAVSDSSGVRDNNRSSSSLLSWMNLSPSSISSSSKQLSKSPPPPPPSPLEESSTSELLEKVIADNILNSDAITKRL